MADYSNDEPAPPFSGVVFCTWGFSGLVLAKSRRVGFKYQSMVALGWGLAHAERWREAGLLSRTGGGRWAAAVANPGCLGISRVPEESTCDVTKGETCLDKKMPWEEGSRQRRCQGLHCQTTVNITTGGWSHLQEAGEGVDSQICLRSLCSLLLSSPSSFSCTSS